MFLFKKVLDTVGLGSKPVSVVLTGAEDSGVDTFGRRLKASEQTDIEFSQVHYDVVEFHVERFEALILVVDTMDDSAYASHTGLIDLAVRKGKPVALFYNKSDVKDLDRHGKQELDKRFDDHLRLKDWVRALDTCAFDSPYPNDLWDAIFFLRDTVIRGRE